MSNRQDYPFRDFYDSNDGFLDSYDPGYLDSTDDVDWANAGEFFDDCDDCDANFFALDRLDGDEDGDYEDEDGYEDDDGWYDDEYDGEYEPLDEHYGEEDELPDEGEEEPTDTGDGDENIENCDEKFKRDNRLWIIGPPNFCASKFHKKIFFEYLTSFSFTNFISDSTKMKN